MTARATVAVLGTMDTKGLEHAYVCEVIRRHGADCLVVDTGILGEPRHIEVDVSADEVARSAGSDLAAVRAIGARGPAVEVMERGLVAVLRRLQQAAQIDAVVALGGAEGTVLGATAMRALPLGFPKLMVSAVASGKRQFGTYMGASDVAIMHSVVDCAGLNRLSRQVFANAGAAAAAMAIEYASRRAGTDAARPVVAISMLGNTQSAFDHLALRLEQSGLEAIPFHANGVGGEALETLARDGAADVVVDMTLNEVSNYLVGGVTDAAPHRLTVAGAAGVPQVIVPGCLDFFTFGAFDTVPAKYRDRPVYRHNPHFTLVRATGSEMASFGAEVARRLNTSTSTVTVLWPEQGLSIEDRRGGSFWDPHANEQLVRALELNLDPSIPLLRIDSHINDEVMADAIAAAVLASVGTRRPAPSVA